MNLVNDIEAFKKIRHANTFFIIFDAFRSACFAQNVSCFDLILGKHVVDGKEDSICSTSFRTFLISSINNDLKDDSLSNISLLTSLVFFEVTKGTS